jgi:hypothetical protein
VTANIYEDPTLTLDADGITLRRYYFPWAGSKRIPYSAIRGVECRSMSWRSGKGRIWGTSHPSYWFPLDVKRTGKEQMLVIDVGHRVKPCVSPDQTDRVVELLSAHVPVTTP